VVPEGEPRQQGDRPRASPSPDTCSVPRGPNGDGPLAAALGCVTVFFSVHTIDGDPEELLRAKREHMDPVVARLAPAHGAIASVTVAGENGITTYNLWRDAEGAAAFSREPEAQEAQRRVRSAGA
jgi:hypothetical protein